MEVWTIEHNALDQGDNPQILRKQTGLQRALLFRQLDSAALNE